MSILTGVIVFRMDAAPTRWEAAMLVICAVGFLGAGLLLAEAMLNLEDRWKDPRMFRLRRLIWLDVGLAASTCLFVAQRRLRPPGSIVLMAFIEIAFLAVAIWQLLRSSPSAPIAGGGCRVGF